VKNDLVNGMKQGFLLKDINIR